MRSSVLFSGLLFVSSVALAQEPPLAIPASPPPPSGEPLAIPAPGLPKAPPASHKGYDAGYEDGRVAAENKAAGEWFGIGVGSGCLLSWVGCGAATATAALVEPTLPQPYASDFYRSSDIERDYWNGFRAGYAQKMKKKRAIRTFAGGTVGTTLLLVGYLGLTTQVELSED